MRRIIFTVLALTLFTSVASADRRQRGRDTSHRSGGTVVRDHRHQAPVRADRHRADRHRNDRRVDRNRYVDRSRHRNRVDRRPVYVNNGRFVFNGGVSRTYRGPVIRQRYYNYQYRPQIIIENYDPVPGYVWVRGHWSWTGYEWTWVSGYYAPDPSYQVDVYYGY